MTENRPATGSNYTFLIIAVVLGVVATAIAFIFLNAQANRAAQTEKITILVAAKNIQNGAVLEPKDWKEKEVPATKDLKDFAAGCFTKNSPPPLRMRVNRAIMAGSPIMLVDVGTHADFDIDTVGTATRPAKRALSIPARDADAVSGLLVPDDMVVLMITKVGSPSTSQPALGTLSRPTPMFQTYPILNGTPLRVLAVGARLSRVRQQFLESNQFEQIKEAENLKTVTLEVTEEQAKEILQENGGNKMPITLLWAGKITRPQPAAESQN